MSPAEHYDDRVYGVVLGKIIAQLRHQAGLRQGQLASRVGVRQSTISRIEAGQVPDALTLHRLAETFDYSTDELHRLTLEGIKRVQRAARVASPKTGSTLGNVIGVLGMVALAGLAVFAVASLFVDEEDER